MNASQLGEGVRIALASLRANKLRTLLTLLGNIVGVMSVIAVVSLMDGIDVYARQKVLDEGSGVFSIQRVNSLQFITDVDAFLDSLYNPRLETQDVEYLRARVPSAFAVDARLSNSGSVAFGDERIESLSIRGHTEHYPAIEDMPLDAGRHLAHLDVRRSRSSCVIGWDVAQELFGDDIDPLGQRIKVAGRSFRVVGVVEERGATLGSSRDRFVIVPLSTWQKLFDAHQSLTIRIKAADVALVDRAIDEATVAMRIRHHLRPSEENDFAVITSQALLDLWNKIEGYIRTVLVAAVSISLLVGGIVLMNVMLVAVTDRTQEIGLRKALGATRINILWQFLVEAITLSLIGGLVGTTIGFSLAMMVSLLSPLPARIQPGAIALGLGVTFLVGILFGTLPANKASRLDPVEALRRE